MKLDEARKMARKFVALDTFKDDDMVQAIIVLNRCVDLLTMEIVWLQTEAERDEEAEEKDD